MTSSQRFQHLHPVLIIPVGWHLDQTTTCTWPKAVSAVQSPRLVNVTRYQDPIPEATDGARILKVDRNGKRSPLLQIRFLQVKQLEPGKSLSGVGDVAFIGHHLYGLLSGAGCTHGVASVPNGIVKVHSDKTWEMIVNLSEYRMAILLLIHRADFEPDGTWYSLIAVGDDLFALDPNTEN